MPEVVNKEKADRQAAKLGLTPEEMGELMKPLWMLLYKHNRTRLTITREGNLGTVEVE